MDAPERFCCHFTKGDSPADRKLPSQYLKPFKNRGYSCRREFILPSLLIWNRLFAHFRNFCLTWPCLRPAGPLKTGEKESIKSQSMQDREISQLCQNCFCPLKLLELYSSGESYRKQIILSRSGNCLWNLKKCQKYCENLRKSGNCQGIF